MTQAIDPDTAVAAPLSEALRAKESALLERLETLGISYTLHRHPPVFTVDESSALCAHIDGAHGKTLFVRDKKRRRAVIIADSEARVPLDRVASALDYGRLSFGSADSMQAMLDVTPGSVTPFALWFAANAGYADLRVVLDATIMGQDVLNYHPLHNAATLSIARDDLLYFIKSCGYTPTLVDMAAPR